MAGFLVILPRYGCRSQATLARQRLDATSNFVKDGKVLGDMQTQSHLIGSVIVEGHSYHIHQTREGKHAQQK